MLYVTSPAPSPHLFGSLGSPGNFKESILPRMEWRRPDLSLVILECKCFGCLKWRVLLAFTDSNPDRHVWYGYIYTHTYTDVPFCFLLKRIDFRPSIQKKRSCQSWFKFSIQTQYFHIISYTAQKLESWSSPFTPKKNGAFLIDAKLGYICFFTQISKDLGKIYSSWVFLSPVFFFPCQNCWALKHLSSKECLGLRESPNFAQFSWRIPFQTTCEKLDSTRHGT